MQVRDKFKIPLKPESAAHSRDALAKSRYRFARSLFSASPHPKHARTQVGCSSKWCNGRCDGTCMHRVVRFEWRVASIGFPMLQHVVVCCDILLQVVSLAGMFGLMHGCGLRRACMLQPVMLQQALRLARRADQRAAAA